MLPLVTKIGVPSPSVNEIKADTIKALKEKYKGSNPKRENTPTVAPAPVSAAAPAAADPALMASLEAQVAQQGQGEAAQDRQGREGSRGCEVINDV